MTTLPQTTSTRLPRPIGQGPITVGGPAHATTAQQAAAGMTAGDVWRVLRANTWLIVIGLFLSGVIGYGANWFLNKYYARFTAKGYIEINATRPPSPLDPERDDTRFDTGWMQVEQRTQANDLRNDGLFNEFLSNGPNIKTTKWYQQFVKKVPQADGTLREVFDIAAAKDDLNDHLGIAPVVDTKLIEVSMTFREPKDCRNIVEDLINQHLLVQGSLKSNKDSDRSQQLSALRNKLTFDHQSRGDDIRKLQNELNKAGINPSGRVVSPKERELEAMVKDQSDTQMKLIEAQGDLDSINQQVANSDTPPLVAQAVDQDPQILTMRNQVDSLEMSLATFDPNNPQSQKYKAMRDRMQAKLDDRILELTSKYTNQIKSVAENKINAAKTSLQGINERIEKSKEELGDLDYKVVQYLQKLDEDKAAREQLETIDKQLDTIRTNNRQEGVIVAWNRRPVIPDTPSFPKLPIVMSVAIGCGLLICLGIAFARELMDTSVRSPRDIARVGQMNLLGMIPHEDDDPQSAGVPLPMVIAQAPTSIIAEQFRQVRTRLQHAAALDTTRSIVVTSPGPQDGKTTVACNLAAGLALNARRILLVDANFRRPELHKIFKIDNNSGLSTVMGSLDTFASTVQHSQLENLDVMSSGPKPANPTELLESQLLIDFIEKALEEYDHVIFDSGPMLLVADTVALAPRVDGVVTVVRARSNSRGLLQRMRDQLRQLKAEHLGVVLNAVRSQGGGYYGRNIKAYYEYQNGHAA